MIFHYYTGLWNISLRFLLDCCYSHRSSKICFINSMISTKNYFLKYLSNKQWQLSCHFIHYNQVLFTSQFYYLHILLFCCPLLIKLFKLMIARNPLMVFLTWSTSGYWLTSLRIIHKIFIKSWSNVSRVSKYYICKGLKYLLITFTEWKKEEHSNKLLWINYLEWDRCVQVDMIFFYFSIIWLT